MKNIIHLGRVETRDGSTIDYLFDNSTGKFYAKIFTFAIGSNNSNRTTELKVNTIEDLKSKLKNKNIKWTSDAITTFPELKENMKKNLKESVFNANKNDKFLLYRKPSNSPSPGHGEYLFASGNTLDELFDNWIKVMKMGGYGYSGSELERQKSLFQKDKLKYWSRPESFYTLKVKRKSDLNQLKMDQDHRKSMAAKDFDNDPRESKQFKLAEAVKKNILKEEKIDALKMESELKSKYPGAWTFFRKVYSTSMYEDIIPVLDDIVSGDLIEREKIEDAFDTLELLLKK